MKNTTDSAKWYTNGISSVRIKPNEDIPDGYHRGRTFKSNPWNKGLTAETDERVKQNGIKTKETRLKDNSYKSWNTGLTKDNNETLAKLSKTMSANRRNGTVQTWNIGIPASEEQKEKQSIAMQGKEPWNKELTKETDERVKSASDKLVGHPCFVTDWEKAKEKEYITKKLNHSFNTSKPEQDYLIDLQNKYGIDDVVPQYQDERYKNPNNNRKFSCDFYIKSLDLFIELNYTWQHGKRPFNENDKQDLDTLANWMLKSNFKESYNQAIKIWTEIDPLKLQVLRKNKLNFMILYPNGLVIDK